MDNLNNILNELGDSIITDAKKLLKARKKNKRSSGKLRKSLKSNLNDTTLTIYGEHYANYVDSGTRYFKGNDYLTDSVDNNLKEYGDKIAEVIGDDILAQIEIILK